MTKRIDYAAISPEAIKILHQQENYLRHQFQQSDTVPVRTWELVKLRVSQINQCAFCIDMHSKDALSMGETAERIYGLSAWRDMPMYYNAERAASAGRNESPPANRLTRRPTNTPWMVSGRKVW